MQNLQHLTGSIIVLLVTVPYTLSLYCYSVHWDAYSSFIEKVHECEEENGYCASMYDRGAEIWFLRAIPLDRKCYTTSELRSRINCSMEKFKEGCFMDSERNSYKRSERKLPVCICSGDYCNTQENIEKIWLEQNIYEFQAAKKCNNDVGNKSAERLTTDQKSRNISESELEKPTTSQKSQKTLTPDPEKPTTDQKSQNISDSNTEKSTIDQKFQNTSQSEPKKPTGDQKSQATFKPAPEELAATTASLETSTTAAPDELTVTTESDKSTAFENFTLPKPTEVPELTQTDFTLTTAEEGAVTKEEHQTTMENLNEPDASETKEILFGTKGGNITETDAGKMDRTAAENAMLHNTTGATVTTSNSISTDETQDLISAVIYPSPMIGSPSSVTTTSAIGSEIMATPEKVVKRMRRKRKRSRKPTSTGTSTVTITTVNI